MNIRCARYVTRQTILFCHEWLALVITWVRDAPDDELANELVIKPLPACNTR